MTRHLRTLQDLTPDEMKNLVDDAVKVKSEPKKYKSACEGKTLAMLFTKTSTRTRVSFEAGMLQLGGHAIYLDWMKTNFVLADLEDEIQALARYIDILMARVYEHDYIDRIAGASAVPVINGLSDDYHPCQALADILTIKEKFGKVEGLTLAWVGDGNNVCNSLVWACQYAGMECRVSTPPAYQISVEVPAKSYTWFEDPKEAVKGADVVYTDTWVSMGQEDEAKERLAIFKPYQVNSNLMKLASKDAIFMHCLPAHRDYEVSSEVFDSPQSVVFGQAENRLHAQKTLILKLLEVEAW